MQAEPEADVRCSELISAVIVYMYCKCHNTSNDLHDNCWKPHPVNIGNISPPEMIVFQMGMDERISETVKQ